MPYNDLEEVNDNVFKGILLKIQKAFEENKLKDKSTVNKNKDAKSDNTPKKKTS
jgi:hypothetical protein